MFSHDNYAWISEIFELSPAFQLTTLEFSVQMSYQLNYEIEFLKTVFLKYNNLILLNLTFVNNNNKTINESLFKSTLSLTFKLFQSFYLLLISLL